MLSIGEMRVGKMRVGEMNLNQTVHESTDECDHGTCNLPVSWG